jgi:putative transposase
VNHFRPLIAPYLCKRRPKPHTIWCLDEAYLKMNGRLVYLWRTVYAEGEVLNVLVQSRKNSLSALKLMRKLLCDFGFLLEIFVADDRRSYGAASRDLWNEGQHRDHPQLTGPV